MLAPHAAVPLHTCAPTPHCACDRSCEKFGTRRARAACRGRTVPRTWLSSLILRSPRIPGPRFAPGNVLRSMLPLEKQTRALQGLPARKKNRSLRCRGSTTRALLSGFRKHWPRWWVQASARYRALPLARGVSSVMRGGRAAAARSAVLRRPLPRPLRNLQPSGRLRSRHHPATQVASMIHAEATNDG